MEKLSLNLALSRILENVDEVTSTEKISVLEATGRVLVGDVVAPIDLPMLNRAAVDGYALKHSDTVEALPDNHRRLKLVGKLTAGEVPEYRLKRGECLQVTTGSVMPEGSDAVVLVENTRLENNTVIVDTPLKKDDYVLHRGEDISVGEIVFRSGRLLRSQDIGAMAGLGIKEIEVLRRARVGIIITGNELLNPEDKINPAKTYDINSYALISEIKKIGAEPVWYGIVQDDYKTISSKLEEMETGIEYWRDYGSCLCEDRFCKERTQTNLVPGKLFERVCGVMDCRVRISDYPDGIVPGLKFYYIMGKLLGHFLDKEAKLIDTELLRV